MEWSNQDKPASFYSPELEAQLKLQFAAALLRNPHSPYTAALTIEPTQSHGRAQYIAHNWPNDATVIEAMGGRIAEVGGARAGLPSKDELALTLWRESQGATDKALKLQYLRTLSDVMGFVERGGGVHINNNNNNLNVPRVMRVPVFATREDWETKAALIEQRLAEA